MVKNILYKHSPLVSCDEIDNKVILIHANLAKAHELNSVASFVWNNLSKGNTEESILKLLINNFAVSKDVAKNDLQILLKKFIENELIIT